MPGFYAIAFLNKTRSTKASGFRLLRNDFSSSLIEIGFFSTRNKAVINLA